MASIQSQRAINDRRKTQLATDPIVPSSSPAFGTPLAVLPSKKPEPIPPPNFKSPTVLSIILPPTTLRPLAFRTFTKKYNLTISTTALAALATFIGRHCGARWKDDGLAEGVLDEVAKMWKKQSTAPIVDGEGETLKSILKTVESCMSGGKIISGKGLSRQSSFAFPDTTTGNQNGTRPALEKQQSFGVSRLEISNEDDDEDNLKDPREWIKVIDAYEQPKMVYNTSKKNFEKWVHRHLTRIHDINLSRSKSKPSILPPPSHKTELFRQRYHLVHQRLLRNENFQQQPLGSNASSHPSDGSPVNKITPIANLLGRTKTQHLLLGLLTVLPTGALAVSDLTGSIVLDLQDAHPNPSSSEVLFCPGMMLLIEGIYVEDGTGEAALGSMGGVGATIAGKFLTGEIAHPPAERRTKSLGIQTGPDAGIGPAFGWTDFLGVGSERATGTRMRRLQSRILSTPLSPPSPSSTATATTSTKIAIAADVALDQPATLSAIRALFAHYAAQPAWLAPPLAIVLMGNFASQPALAGSTASATTSLLYKESFNSLAAVLSDFPAVLARTSLVFVPGDGDAWPSAFGAGGAVPLPRRPVPNLFTTRVGRVVAEANREVRGRGKSGAAAGKEGEVIWASNPARLTWFGCVGEMVLFRDDISGRMRRSTVRFVKQKEESEGQGDAEMQDYAGDTQPMEVDGADPSANGVAEPDQQTDADIAAARQLTRTILEQAHLSPFPISSRPVHWDYGGVLSLFPLPSSLVLADPEAPPFTVNYMGCCVMNPGKLVEGRRGIKASWVEYDVLTNKAEVVVKED